MATNRQLRTRLKPSPKPAPILPRPVRMLNTGLKRRACNELAEVNSTQSPLLQLPPEVRNIIYGYALGGRVVHVTSDENYRNAHRFSLCIASHSDEDAASDLREAISAREFDYYDNRHRRYLANDASTTYPMDSRTKLDICLSLLQTCTQVHREAALIPFQSNVFSGSEYDLGIRSRLRRLVPVQLRAIRSITLHIRSFRYPFATALWPGLEDVTIMVELSDWALRDTQTLDLGLSTNRDPSLLLQSLKKIDLKTARVLVCVRRYDGSPPGTSRSAECEAIAKAAETRLLEPTEAES